MVYLTDTRYGETIHIYIKKSKMSAPTLIQRYENRIVKNINVKKGKCHLKDMRVELALLPESDPPPTSFVFPWH